MRLLASDLKRVDIAQLDPEALGNIKQLSVSLTPTSTPGRPARLAVLGLSFRSGPGMLCPHNCVAFFPLWDFDCYPAYLAAIPSLNRCCVSVYPRVPATKFRNRIEILPHPGSWCLYVGHS